MSKYKIELGLKVVVDAVDESQAVKLAFSQARKDDYVVRSVRRLPDGGGQHQSITPDKISHGLKSRV